MQGLPFKMRGDHAAQGSRLIMMGNIIVPQLSVDVKIRGPSLEHQEATALKSHQFLFFFSFFLLFPFFPFSSPKI